MALSFYSNRETMAGNLINQDLTQFQDQQSELTDALIGLYDPIDFPIDSLFDPSPNEHLFNYSEPTTTAMTAQSYLIPSFSDPSILSLPIDDFDLCRCPKRHKSCSDLYQPSDYLFDVNLNNAGFAGFGAKKNASLSAQSVAARERRKRISDKTQELGKLIPGGNKMNTAEMFHAAFKYVKFLQAQVGILGLMGSMQGGAGSDEVADDLQAMLKSSAIQEKLSSEEKCIVPKEMVDALSKDDEIRSSPLISRELNRFIESRGRK